MGQRGAPNNCPPPPRNVPEPLGLCALSLELGGGGGSVARAVDTRTHALLAPGPSCVPALVIVHTPACPAAPAAGDNAALLAYHWPFRRFVSAQRSSQHEHMRLPQRRLRWGQGLGLRGCRTRWRLRQPGIPAQHSLPQPRPKGAHRRPCLRRIHVVSFVGPLATVLGTPLIAGQAVVPGAGHGAPRLATPRLSLWRAALPVLGGLLPPTCAASARTGSVAMPRRVARK